MWILILASPRTRCVVGGGNTAAANAGVRQELRMGQARWKAPMGQMVDHYDEVGLERQLSVSYLLSDEAPFNGYDWS